MSNNIATLSGGGSDVGFIVCDTFEDPQSERTPATDQVTKRKRTTKPRDFASDKAFAILQVSTGK